ncbi:helix-turn-helix transcriptional regulator [Dehalococcoides sp. THU3]|uniref:helix-turn-helix transcriptional regulator n=1 Tax=Dehalococcoides TaxID=61434 RepID=UPI00062D38B4|nr:MULTISPECIES: helix-turn-helix transcriptional regulator [Dehalococcoides]QYY58766.1 helix-turn-helix transcriptional regulator [Dehalococcoides mccartyi]
MNFQENNNSSVVYPASGETQDTGSCLKPIPLPIEGQTDEVEIALRERVKELNCMYGIFQLAERHHSSLNRFLFELVNFLPNAWQYPDITKAKIVFRGHLFLSTGFKVSNWYQSSPVLLNGELIGECTIYYTEERPVVYEGPFLKEERILLNNVTVQIGNIAGRIAIDEELEEINRQLKLERQALQEANMALKVILSRGEAARQDIYNDINQNVDKILKPILLSLEAQLPPSQKIYTQLILSNLEDISSSFVTNLSGVCNCLSPVEIAVSNMVKNGLTTKEIASLRGVSPATINHHRENIRRKFKIVNQSVNLSTFLQSNLNILE